MRGHYKDIKGGHISEHVFGYPTPLSSSAEIAKSGTTRISSHKTALYSFPAFGWSAKMREGQILSCKLLWIISFQEGLEFHSWSVEIEQTMKMLRGTVFLSTFSSSRFFHSSSFSNHPQTLYKERSLTLNVGHWTFSTYLNSLCYLYLYLVSIQEFYSVHLMGRVKSVTFRQVFWSPCLSCGSTCLAHMLIWVRDMALTQKYLCMPIYEVDKTCKTRNFFDAKVRYQKLCINFPFPCKVPG